jgi:hypothetical protein
MSEQYSLKSYKELLKEYPNGQLPTYKEKLNTIEWKLFREQILERDHFACQKCAIWKWKRLPDEEYQAKINLQAADQLINPYIFLFDDADIEEIAKEDPQRANETRAMKIKNNPPILDWYVLNDRKPLFEVHHKDYIIGALPWEYPNSWLITLCEDCHHKVHFGDENTPPVLRKVYKDKTKREEVLMNRCHRCNGRGYIWEYRYYKGGLCFDCGGQGQL